MLTGAQIMCEALIRENVRVLFGIPGGAIMPFYHAHYAYRDRLRHVLCRHEQGAGHAAEGYARASGRVGVCIATSGPGATNLVTPIADAWMDSTPIVAITGQVSSALLGTDAFQETDITGITIPITKHSYLVRDAREIPRVFREAFHIASSGRPGPVLIDVTKDAQQARVDDIEWSDFVTTPDEDQSAADGDHADIRKAVALLVHAERPLILAGHGVIQSAATNELRLFAELAHIPVITTLHGKGALPEDHPLSLGMPGMHGWVHVNRAIQECDVLFNIGGRFDDRVTGKASTFAPRATVIHVDIDPSEIGKNVRANLGIVGDARQVLGAMLEELREGERNYERDDGRNCERDYERDHERHGERKGRSNIASSSAVSSAPSSAVSSAVRSEWLGHIRDLQAKHQPHQAYMRRPNTNHLMPHDVYAALNRFLAGRRGYRVVTDVGQHQMWAAQLIDWRHPRSHITSGGAGTMGFAVPAALGAALACPDETIWVIVGDGGFQMTNQELATIRQENVRNVKICIVNNGYLGMVRQWQELFENRVYSATPLSGPCFGQLAEAYGIRGITVERAGDVDAAFQYATECNHSVVIDFRVEQEANVFPIVPQGKSIGEMITA